MCQAAPGPRCYRDSVSKLSKVGVKLDKARAAVADCNSKMDALSKEGRYAEWAKAKLRLDRTLAPAVANLEKQFRHVQRDLDGTKTGARILREQIANAKTEAERVELRQRVDRANGIRYGREHALMLKQRNYRPLFRIDLAQAA